MLVDRSRTEEIDTKIKKGSEGGNQVACIAMSNRHLQGEYDHLQPG